MTNARDRLRNHDEDGSPAPATRRAPDLGHVPAIAGPADPRLSHGRPVAGLMHLQRTAGNAAVSALVAPAVQRVVAIDEVTTEVAPPTDAGSDAGATTTAGAGPVTSDGATTTISGSAIRLDAAITSTDGVIRANTIVADNVIGSNYTPGTGNMW